MVGGASLIDELQINGAASIKFDKCLATPDMMGKLSKIARLLGPKGMMPSPKLGTVVTDLATAVKEMKAGRVEFRCVGRLLWDDCCGMTAVVKIWML